MKQTHFPAHLFSGCLGIFLFILFRVTVIYAASSGSFEPDHLARFITWSVKEGVGSDKVLDIIEDKYGIIWIATTGGLTKFDGTRFTVYRHDPADTNSVSDNTVTSLAEDREGNLWIGTFYGLNKLERRSGRFVRYDAVRTGLTDNHVLAVHVDREGFLWVHTKDGTLLKFNEKTGQREYTSHRSAFVEGEYYYHHIFEDANNNLWIGGRASGICMISGKNIKSIKTPVINPSVEYFEGACFAENKQGDLFASDDKGNFSRYHSGKGIFETVLNIPLGVTCAVTDADNRIWVGGSNGLLRLDMERGDHKQFLYNSRNSRSLASNCVYCLLKDSRDNIWVGTDRGLSLYSRSLNRIRSFRMIPGSGTELSSNVITALMQDRDGLLWVGTEENGVDTVNLRTGATGNLKYELLKGNLSPGVAERERYTLMQYRRHKVPLPNRRINENKVSALYEDKAGKIYIGLWSHIGFNVYDKQKRAFKRYCLWSIPAGYIFPLLFEGNLFGANWYAGFLEDSRSNFWCATWEGVGLNLFNRDKGAFTGRHFIPGDVPRMPRGAVYSFVRDSTEERIYMAGDQYYGYYDIAARTFHRYAEQFPSGYPNRDIIREYYRYCGAELLEIPVNTASLRVLAKTGERMLIASANSLCLHNTATGKIDVLYKPKEFYPYYTVAESRDKKYWYISWKRDIIKVATDGSSVLRAGSFIRDIEKILPETGVRYFYETAEGDLVLFTGAGEFIWPHNSLRLLKRDYFGIPCGGNVCTVQNGSGGAVYIGTDHGLYKSAPPFTGKPVLLLDSVAVNAVYRDRGILYVCTAGGLYLLDENTGERKQHFRYRPQERYSLPANMVYSAVRIDDSLLFVSNGTCLARLNEREGRFTDVLDDVHNTLSSRLASCILEDSGGYLWYGTTEAGVNRIDPVSGKIERFSYHEWDSTCIPGNNIGDVFEDSRRIIWVGTGRGLCRFCPGGTFEKVKELEGRKISRILEDTAGRLWISTDHGLYCYHPVTGSVRSFYSYNGFLNDTYSRAACRLDDGRMAFGGSAGFDVFDPDAVNTWQSANIVFTEFKGGDRLSYADMPETVRLSSSGNSFSVDFAALDYTFAAALNYRYRLAGFDKEWIYTGAVLPQVKYTNLSGGRYSLEVEATNVFGEWSGNKYSRLIYVDAPFYMRWWFIAVGFICAGIVIYIYILLREKALKEKNRQLSLLVEQRTSEIKKEIDSKNRFFSIISHDLKNPLTALGVVSGGLCENYTKITEQERLEMLESIRSASLGTAQLLDSLLLWVLSQMDMIHPHYVKLSLYAAADPVIALFALQAQQKGVTIENGIAPDLLAFTDENMYSTVLRNLIGNAVKYSRLGGSVLVTAGKLNGKIYISVKDNGVGMRETIREKLFRIDTKINTRGTRQEGGTGIGLIITAELLKKLGEEISVTSREGEGSVFVFSVKEFEL